MRWLPWLAGTLLLAAVIAAALHVSDAREFVRLAQGTEPWWLVVALALQAATYLAQGEVWRCVGRAARFSISLATAYALSLAKLFADQALPSGGISGVVVVARSLEALGMPRPAAMSAVVVNTASNYIVYVLGLAVALAFLVHDQTHAIVAPVAIVFSLFAVGVTVAVLALSGRGSTVGAEGFARLRPTRLLKVLGDADPHLARNPRLLGEASAYQIAIVLLDAATVWVLIQALGATASPSGVFASFMVSRLLRTVGVLPGGLGTFEAASVLTLTMAGVSVPVALAATLLFRGLSFWLPMLPGLWFSRHAMTRRPADPQRAGIER